jgi:hypothetical protein
VKAFITALLFFSLFIQERICKAQDQDLFSVPNSLKFAIYLENSGRYKDAAFELERIALKFPSVDSIQASLLRNYRLANLEIQSIRYFKSHPLYAKGTCKEYSSALLKAKQFKEHHEFVSSANCFSSNKKNLLFSFEYAFQNKWDDALTSVEMFDANEMEQFPILKAEYQKGKNFKMKKPEIAGLLSAAVPGLGKVYTKDWKDAIFSFVFVGTTAFQAYRGFALKGKNSVRGWIFSGLCLGFYTGNIYGAAYSAKRYNQRKLQTIRAKIEELAYTVD